MSTSEAPLLSIRHLANECLHIFMKLQRIVCKKELGVVKVREQLREEKYDTWKAALYWQVPCIGCLIKQKL